MESERLTEEVEIKEMSMPENIYWWVPMITVRHEDGTEREILLNDKKTNDKIEAFLAASTYSSTVEIWEGEEVILIGCAPWSEHKDR